MLWVPLALSPLLRPGSSIRTTTPIAQSNPEPHATVIFLRHGQSTWNEASLFTGWADVELTTLGKNEAAKAATAMWKEGFEVDVAYTSRLKRAQQTLEIVLKITGQEHVHVHKCWKLNERMYGALTGLNKKETAEKYGADQVKEWRRSFDTRPPDIDRSSKYWPGNDNEYAHIPEDDIPLAECLKDTIERTVPYWERDIVPALKRGKTVLVAAHGNSIRGLLKHLDGISDEGIMDVEVPTGIPLVYHLDADLQPLHHERAVKPLSGYFLGDSDAVAAAQKQVAEQSQVRYGEKETTEEEDRFLCIGSGCVMLSNGDMRDAFDAFDTDGNGLITAAELQRAISRLSDGEEEATDAQVAEMIQAVDRNNDGQIDFGEFVQALTAQPTEEPAAV